MDHRELWSLGLSSKMFLQIFDVQIKGNTDHCRDNLASRSISHSYSGKYVEDELENL